MTGAQGDTGADGALIPGDTGPTGDTGPCDDTDDMDKPPCNHDHDGETITPSKIVAKDITTSCLIVDNLNAGSLTIQGKAVSTTTDDICGDEVTFWTW